MNFVIALIAGLVIGWGASMRAGTDGREDLIRNILVGSVGALIGGWILTAAFASADSASFSFGGIVAAMSGAAAALVFVDRVRKA